MNIVYLLAVLIRAEGAKTPVGAAGQVRPRRSFLRRGGSPHAPRKAKRLVTGKNRLSLRGLFREAFLSGAEIKRLV
jgi:hypothetical protein